METLQFCIYSDDTSLNIFLLTPCIMHIQIQVDAILEHLWFILFDFRPTFISYNQTIIFNVDEH